MKKLLLFLLALATPLFFGGNSNAQMVTDTFSFTGSQQTFVVPADVNSIFVDVRGAQGEINALIV